MGSTRAQRLMLVLFAVFLLLLYFESRGVSHPNAHFRRVPFLPPQWRDTEEDEEGDALHPMDTFERIKRADSDISVNGHNISFDFPVRTAEERPFRVHLILHSHVDPGWLETFEEYYVHKVKTILDGAVEGLSSSSVLRFIWSEMSFLERWWRDADEGQKRQFRGHLASGKLELCGGAWVMTDEATPHFFSTIDNMVEGQQFVLRTFNLTPVSSWSVDPFGHGLMLPFLNPLSGVENMVVGRLNDVIKGQMRQRHAMRWRWTQPYEIGPPAPPTVLTLPYLYYTTRNACGPDEQVCCQGQVGPSVSYYNCPGGMDRYLRGSDRAQFKQYVRKLVDQWRVLQKLYDSDEILVPIGDDFYLTNKLDWNVLNDAWGEVIKEVSADPSLRVKVQFSTVTEYFEAVKNSTPPTLSGDFFPYIGEVNNPHKWWSGYFTHRPHHKRMERILMSQLRTTDVMQAVLVEPAGADMSEARRNLALFQHHDGITGTSKPHVMEDYLARLRNASTALLSEQTRLLARLLNVSREEVATSVRSPSSADRDQPPLNVIDVHKKKALVVFNQLPSVVEHKVVVLVNSLEVGLRDSEGNAVPAQLSPHFQPAGGNVTAYELTFFAKLKPLQFTTFEIIDGRSETTSMGEVIVGKDGKAAPKFGSTAPSVRDLSQFRSKTGKTRFELGNGTKIGNLESEADSFDFDFVTYDDHSGAYVFEGNERQENLGLKKVEYVVDGPLETQVVAVYGSEQMNVTVVLRVSHSDFALFDELVEMELFPVVADHFDVFMRVRAGVDNSEGNSRRFSTDINAMYLLERNYEGSKPIAANIFATPTAGFVQDRVRRLTVLTGQPAGMTSLRQGELLVHVDRQLSTSDGKGLSNMDALEHHRAHVRYRLLVEPRSTTTSSSSSSSSGSAHSIRGQRALDSMLYTSSVFALNNRQQTTIEPKVTVSKWPCGVEAVSMRHLDQTTLLLILRRVLFDESVSGDADCEANSLDPVWQFVSALGRSARFCSLTGTVEQSAASLDSLAERLQRPFSIVSLKIAI